MVIAFCELRPLDQPAAVGGDTARDPDRVTGGVSAVVDPAPTDPALTTEEVRTAWRRLNSMSVTILPLRARGASVGALTMVRTGTRPAGGACREEASSL